jgi:nitroreductase
LRLVQAAILAANAHNTQPWIFQIHENVLAIYADRARHLGAFDPFRRELTLSLGCALQNIVLTAPGAGYRLRVRLEPGALNADPPADLHRVAVIGLEPIAPEPHALHDTVARRHTDRGPYDRRRGVPGDLLEGFNVLAAEEGLKLFFFDEGRDREAFDRLMLDATDYIGRDREMMEASHAWFRNTPEEVAAQRDGLTLEGAGVEGFTKAMARILPPLSAREAHAYWRRQTEEAQLATAPLVGMICVRVLYDQIETLAAGRFWQHMHLVLAAEGYAAQPMNQPAEVVDRQRQLSEEAAVAKRLAALTGDAAWKPTFLFRLGASARDVPRSPRRSLDKVVSA